MLRVPTTSRRRVLAVVMLVPIALLALGGRAAGEDAAAAALKAAFLFNFVKFAQWPADAVPSGAGLVLCVLGDDQVATTLEGMTKGRPIDSHELVVKRVTVDSAVKNCQMIYLSGLAAKQSAALTQSLHDTPALTVSDLPGFAHAGGIINFVVEDGKLRFVINADAAARAHLRLSSKLLSLASLVKD